MPPENRKRRNRGPKGPNTESWTPEEREARAHAERMETPIAQLDLDVRIINTLEDNQIIYVNQLVIQTYETLMKMRNFGEATLKAVRAALAKLGLKPPEWKKPKKPPKPPRSKGRPMGLLETW